MKNQAVHQLPLRTSPLPAVNVAVGPQGSLLRSPRGQEWVISYVGERLRGTSPWMLSEPFTGGGIRGSGRWPGEGGDMRIVDLRRGIRNGGVRGFVATSPATSDLA